MLHKQKRTQTGINGSSASTRVSKDRSWWPSQMRRTHAGDVVKRADMRTNLVAGLDIGSTRTCAVIAEVIPSAKGRPVVKILGVGQAKTGGMRREVVTDIEGTTESVRKAIKEAELMAGVTIDRVFTGVAGEYIHART
jgi:hypothetical protein